MKAPISDIFDAIRKALASIEATQVAPEATKTIKELETIFAGVDPDRAKVSAAIEKLISVSNLLKSRLPHGAFPHDLLRQLAAVGEVAEEPIVPPSYPPSPDYEGEASEDTLAMLDELRDRLQGNDKRARQYPGNRRPT